MKKLYKINQFTTAEWNGIEYDWNEHEDEIVIIEKKDAYCMDITANGKRIVPILRKIESSLTEAGLAGNDGIYAGWFGEWANSLTDRVERKYFTWSYSGQSDIERGCWSYSWGIEQINEDQWYVFLNIAKPQEAHQEAPQAAQEAAPDQQPAETEEAPQAATQAAQEPTQEAPAAEAEQPIDDATLSAIAAIIAEADRMSGAYFFQPPQTAGGRRSYERYHSHDTVTWTESGHTYSAAFTVACTCSNVYANGNYTRDGKRTTLTPIRNSYKRISA